MKYMPTIYFSQKTTRCVCLFRKYIHTYIHTNIHTNIHTHIHTNKQTTYTHLESIRLSNSLRLLSRLTIGQHNDHWLRSQSAAVQCCQHCLSAVLSRQIMYLVKGGKVIVDYELQKKKQQWMSVKNILIQNILINLDKKRNLYLDQLYCTRGAATGFVSDIYFLSYKQSL